MRKDARGGDRHAYKALSVRFGNDHSLLELLARVRYPDEEKPETGMRRLVQEAVREFIKQQIVEDREFQREAIKMLTASQTEPGTGREREHKGATAT